MENQKTQELAIVRMFDAPREMVWKAWTEPEQMMKWWGPKPFTAPVIKIDLRVGGSYLFCMRGSVGPDQPTMDFWSGGVYKEIVPFEKIVYTDRFTNEHGDVVDPAIYGMPPEFPKENVVTVTFEEVAGKTKLTILYVVESEAVLEKMLSMRMREGWESSLQKLAESLV